MLFSAMNSRTGTLNFVLNPRAGAYEGPLAVLVDEMSMSTSEILAGGLQDLGRAHVFGTRTPGAALPSVVERLPNGKLVNNTEAIFSLGGATMDNEWNYAHLKMWRSLGLIWLENQARI